MDKAMKIIEYIIAWLEKFYNMILGAFDSLSKDETTTAAE